MCHTGFLDTLLIWGQSQKHVRALTLVELLLAIAILGTLSAIAVPSYSNYIHKARNSTAITDIRKIELEVTKFQVERGTLPNSLVQAGLTNQIDPWGRPYQYVRVEGLSKHEREQKCRWAKFEKPLNDDFDLYSTGKDGRTKPRIDHKDSFDDIVRANGGAYIGPASEY
jgi:general secretion pathway protein G